MNYHNVDEYQDQNNMLQILLILKNPIQKLL